MIFFLLDCLPSKVKEPIMPNYLLIIGGRIIGFIHFPRVLVLCEMQSSLSRIWICVAVLILYDDNHYTMIASYYIYIIYPHECMRLVHACVCLCVCVCVCVWERERERERDCVRNCKLKRKAYHETGHESPSGAHLSPGLPLFRLQSFPSPKLVAMPRLKSPIYPTILTTRSRGYSWIHAFPKWASALWEKQTISFRIWTRRTKFNSHVIPRASPFVEHRFIKCWIISWIWNYLCMSTSPKTIKLVT